LGELGLPRWVIPAVSIALPAVEIVVAALLLIEPLATLGALCALGLLTIFTVVILVNLWHGRRPACACFGALSRGHIGLGTLARNILLMTVAAMLLLPPPPVLAAPPATFIALPTASTLLVIASVLAGGVILFLAWFVFQLWRQQGRLLLRIEQLEHHPHLHPQSLTTHTEAPEPMTLPRPPDLTGQPAPPLTLLDVTGQRIDLQSSRGTPTVVLFLESTCRHCQPLLARLRTWRPAARVDTRVIVVLAGQRPHSLEFAPGIVVVDGEDSILMHAFGILGTPSAIAIDADGIVSRPAARGYAAVMQLLDSLPLQEAQEEQYEIATV
jgi:hypothetical protein